MTTNSDPATHVYLGWVNSILCEAGLLVGSLDDLKSGVALATLIDTLWPDAHLSTQVQETDPGDTSRCIQNVQVILDYLTDQGFTNHISSQDVFEVEEAAWSQLLWHLILHYCIHSPGSETYEHTEEAGIQSLLDWCLLMLPGVSLDKEKPLVDNISCENLLVHLIAQFCPVEEDPDAVGLLMNAMLSAEEYLGISKYIVDPVAMVESTIPERHVLVYLALLRRKSDQIEEMGSMAAQMAAAQGVEKLDLNSEEENSYNVGHDGEEEITDPQQFLNMLGDQAITPEMLQQLQDRFGPIEIEIIEGSSEESGDPGASQNSSHGLLEEEDEDVSPLTVWPQQPIFHNEPGSKPSNVPLLVELEQAEEAERLSQELLQSRHSDDMDDDHEMDFPILGKDAAMEQAQAQSSGLHELGFDQEMVDDSKRNSRRAFSSSSMKHLSGSLKPPWMSPVPFSQPGNEVNMLEGHGEHDHLRHSTPRHLSETENSDSDGNNDEGVATEAQKDTEMDINSRIYQERQAMVEEQDDMEYEETEIDIEDLTKEEIQDLLMAAQEQGVPFDPRLIDLAAQRGLEFEIVMEDEEGNIIEGLPNGEPMKSTNFTELVQELKIASGQEMEVSLQYDSGVGTGTTIATATDTDPESMGASMTVGALQQQIRQHLSQTSDNRRAYPENDMIPNVPTTSLNDLRDISDGEEIAIGYDGENKYHTNRIGNETGNKIQRQKSKDHFQNKNISRPESRKGNVRSSLFSMTGEDLSTVPVPDNKNDDKDSVSDDEGNRRKPESAKSSDVDTDNEDGEKRKWESNKSDRSFSSNTSIDGIIDTRADLDESEEEIVITMEVPGIPTEDGGFIIDMSKMFIPISIPGQGDQEITVEIDPSGFDFSSMVQNEDGSIEVDIEREVNRWMAQSASKSVRYGPGMKGGPPDTDDPIFQERSKITEQIDNGDDSEVNSAIRAAVTEQFPNKSSSDESQGHTGPTIRPLSESPASQPQHDTSSRSIDASIASSSSMFDVSPAEDEVLQLLDQIGNKGHLMRQELESSHQREISLHNEKSEDEVRLYDTIASLEKEMLVLKKENKKLYKDINSGRSTSNRDQNMIQRLEGAMDDLQNRVHTLQRENNDLKSLNATLERRSRMVIHQGVMTETAETENKSSQVGNPSFKLRSRTTQTAVANTVDFGVQQYGHYFSKNAATTTHDPIFRSLRSKTLGTQSESVIKVDRGLTAISAQEKLWFGFMSHASTQVRAVSKSHEPRKATKDASTATTTQQEQKAVGDDTSEHKYPWQPRKSASEQVNLSNIPLKAGKPLRPIHTRAAQGTGPKIHSGPLKPSQPAEKLHNQMNQVPPDSPLMENSATESMDTDDEPEGPDKWQRLSSASLATDDPTVVKLQRSLASATLENDLLQSKMKQSKTEMATRLEEWAALLEASKSELDRAKGDTVGHTAHKKNSNIWRLEQKVEDLQEALAKAQKTNHLSSQRMESPSPQSLNQTPHKVKYLEKQNTQLRNTLDKVKREKDQLIKDFSQLRQHHHHSVEAVTELESSLVGMASERHHLRSEIQVLRDEYEYLKKGMDIMERYFNADLLSSTDDDELGSRPTSSCSQASVLDEAINEVEADITVLHHSDLAAKESEAVLSALKDEQNESGVVVMPSGGVEGSLHKHISALAARIQSELGIKVQLVGEVDPTEILGASIHSQDGGKQPSTQKQDRLEADAVEHLFQSVKPEGSYRKLNLTDLQEAEDIVSRAIPSPRDTSRDSSPVSPRQSGGGEQFEKKDIGSLDSVELRRKRLGMFVEAYTKPRENSPEGRSLSPVGRSPSPEKARKASPTTQPELASVNGLVEPSTDHQMKTYIESRHQIQTQSPLSPRDTSRSPSRNLEAGQKSENMRKKFTTGNTPLLPSKFNLTSVGVSRNGGSQTPDPEVPSGNSGHPWSSGMKWKPFSRLARAARLKQEPRPPSRGLSKSDMEAEAALIQDDILLRYGGESLEQSQSEEPAPRSSKVRQNSGSSSKARREKKVKDQIKQSNTSEAVSKRSSSKEHTRSSRSTRRTSDKSSRPESEYQVKPSQPDSWYDERSSSATPIASKETSSVFKDFDYTDYLLSKYGGDDESTDANPLSEYQSDYRSSSAFSSLPSPDIAEDTLSSDSDSLLRGLHTSSNKYPSMHTTSKFEGFTTQSRSSGVSRTVSSSPTIKPQPTSRNDTGYSPKPIRESPTRSTKSTHSRLPEGSRSERHSSASQSKTSRKSSRSDLSSANLSSTPSTDHTDSVFRTDSSSISPAQVRLHSSPPLRSSYTPVSSPRSSVTPQPWHSSSRQSSFSPYRNDTLDSSRSESRTFYSEFFNKDESEDKYWKEPKQYDYRHESSPSSWREPRKREAWGEVDRQWPDTSITSSSANLRLYNGASNSPSANESHSSGHSTPYQSLADQWTFSSSSRIGAEGDRRGRSSSYLDRGSSALYGHGRRSYDRPVTDVSSPTRSILTKNVRDRPSYDVFSETSPSADHNSYSGALYGNESFLTQNDERSFMDNILDKYAAVNESSSYLTGRRKPFGSAYGTISDRFESALDREPYRTTVDMDRYMSTANKYDTHTPAASYPEAVTSATSYSASRYGNTPRSSDIYNGYGGYSSKSASEMLADEKGRARRAEIDELLNKYAPMY